MLTSSLRVVLPAIVLASGAVVIFVVLRMLTPSKTGITFSSPQEGYQIWFPHPGSESGKVMQRGKSQLRYHFAFVQTKDYNYGVITNHYPASLPIHNVQAELDYVQKTLLKALQASHPVLEHRQELRIGKIEGRELVFSTAHKYGRLRWRMFIAPPRAFQLLAYVTPSKEQTLQEQTTKFLNSFRIIPLQK